jgi:hypothetical protein
MLKKRKGALPPIVTVLIVVAAVVATALVAWFLYASTARATRTAMIFVMGVPTLYADGKLYLTVKNDGTADLPLSDARVVVQTAGGSVECSLTSTIGSIPAGGSANLLFNCPSDRFNEIPDGALAKLQAGGYEVSFAVAKPG